MQNPLDTDLVVEFVQSNSGEFNETFAFFAEPIENFVIPAHGTANSGPINNVLLTQGAIASLAIIPDEKLDIQAAATVQVGQGGYTIPWLQLVQFSVPTTYTLDLGLAAMKQKAISISASASASSASASASVSAVASVKDTTSAKEAESTSSAKDTQSTAEDTRSAATTEATVTAATTEAKVTEAKATTSATTADTPPATDSALVRGVICSSVLVG
jgi:hypothetical protein